MGTVNAVVALLARSKTYIDLFQVSDSVQLLIMQLVNNVITPENFQAQVQSHIGSQLKQVCQCRLLF